MDNIREITIEAKLEKVEEVLKFVNTELESRGVPFDVLQRIDLALEEIVVNICSYAYPEGQGIAIVAVSFPKENVIQLDIKDRGIPYDPLKKPDPDISIPLKQSKIGGLGIYMTKKSMDEIAYEYEDGYNHMTLIKYTNA